MTGWTATVSGNVSNGAIAKTICHNWLELAETLPHSRSKTQSVTNCFLVQINHIMKTRFNLFRRAGVFYTEDTATGKQTSLRTRDETEAKSLLNARNEAQRLPVLNLHLARAYLTASDPAFMERTWQTVMEQLQSRGNVPRNLLRIRLPLDTLILCLVACGHNECV